MRENADQNNREYGHFLRSETTSRTQNSNWIIFLISNNIQEFILDTELIPVIPSDDSPI